MWTQFTFRLTPMDRHLADSRNITRCMVGRRRAGTFRVASASHEVHLRASMSIGEGEDTRRGRSCALNWRLRLRSGRQR